MSDPLLRCLARWTAASAGIAMPIAGLLPIAASPANRADRALARICAAVAIAALVSLWAAAGVSVLASVRSSPAPGRRRPRPIAGASEAAEAPEAPEAPEALR